MAQMNKKFASVFLSLMFGAAIPGSATAQRVIEERLGDPTVAAPRHWLLGAALEYWYVRSDHEITSASGATLAEGTIKYAQPGFNIYAGRGDFTVFVAARKGDGDIDLTYAPGTLGPTQAQTNSRVEQEDREIALRWIFLKRPHFAPYVVAGYSWTEYEENETFTTPGFTWPATGTASRRTTVEYTAPLFGIGAVVPVNERFGLRIDGRLKFYKAERKSQGVATVSDNGVGGDFTAAAYFNLVEGLNIQAGGRYSELNGGDAVGSVARVGWFAMLGYIHRF
jgi:hypothetical protein